jgi:hypothetical protein
VKKSIARGMIYESKYVRTCETFQIRATYSLLQVFTDLVVDLELLVQSFQLFLVDVTALEVVHRRWLRRLEEVEERIRRNDLLDDSGSVGVCDIL